MIPVSARRLHDYYFSALERDRVVEQRCPARPQVARKDHDLPSAILLNGHLDACRADDVPRVHQTHLNSRSHLDALIVSDGFSQGFEATNITLFIKRFQWR